MSKKNKAQAEVETVQAVDTVMAIVKEDAPFGVLKYGDYEVTKNAAIEVPASIVEHRFSSWLIIS